MPLEQRSEITRSSTAFLSAQRGWETHARAPERPGLDGI
jgi:hypothetical protein